MDKTIDQQIEEQAANLEKSQTTPQERLTALIKSLGKDELAKRVANLNEEDKVVLKAVLEDMKKAISFDKEYAAKMIQGKVSETIIQEDIASDDADEKLVKPAAAKMDHQGTPTEGWQGQVIKSINESDELMDQVVEKAMEKCGDEMMAKKKLAGKGLHDAKVQGAIEKYKKKKEMKKSEEETLEKAKKEKEEAAKKIMAMEEKEHGTKDPKKLVQAEKKEHMKKSVTWDDETRLLKANTQGRNFNFNVENFINETLANEPKEQPVVKAEKEDVNDLIQKSLDKDWTQVNTDRSVEAAAKKQNGKLVKSFDEETELAAILGLTPEEAKKILG